MDPADLTALAAALEVPFGARREQRLYQRRGGPRRGSGRAGGHNRTLDLTDHLLLPVLRPLFAKYFRVETQGLEHVHQQLETLGRRETAEKSDDGQV